MIINTPQYGAVEIVNWEEFRNKVLFILGEEIVQAIQAEATGFDLVDTGRYVRGFKQEVVDGELHIDNDVEYAAYLEYGTYDYYSAFGLENYPNKGDVIKKKDLKPSTRRLLPKGMMPFAPVRRILYSQAQMDKIIRRAF